MFCIQRSLFIALLLATTWFTLSVSAQENPSTDGTARIVGAISDGSPPPESPKPSYVAASEDILTTTRVQAGRTVTI